MDQIAEPPPMSTKTNAVSATPSIRMERHDLTVSTAASSIAPRQISLNATGKSRSSVDRTGIRPRFATTIDICAQKKTLTKVSCPRPLVPPSPPPDHRSARGSRASARKGVPIRGAVAHDDAGDGNLESLEHLYGAEQPTP